MAVVAKPSPSQPPLVEYGLVDSTLFYEHFPGHPVEDLDLIHRRLRAQGHRSFVFLAGDSTLDNHAEDWVGRGVAQATNGYEAVLAPPTMRRDVCYWLNERLAGPGHHRQAAAVNTAVEESTLAQREDRLLPQESFLRDRITEDDFLVVSVGGNDIVMDPSLRSAMNMMILSYCTCTSVIRHGRPPPALEHFLTMFGNDTERYVRRLVSKRKPRKVLVCMVYFLDEVSRGGWAECPLCLLWYNVYPEKLQTAIRRVFELATCKIRVPGTEVLPTPLYEALDGRDPLDYTERVEPSPLGGRKLADYILRKIFGA